MAQFSSTITRRGVMSAAAAAALLPAAAQADSQPAAAGAAASQTAPATAPAATAPAATTPAAAAPVAAAPAATGPATSGSTTPASTTPAQADASQATPPAKPLVTVTPQTVPWTRQAYEKAMRASGRPVSLTDAQFDAIQKRKPAAMKLIKSYLDSHLHQADPAVLAAFEAVPREYFHYIYSEHRATPGDAYETNPKPWAIGYGSALSDYLGQAYMTQICQPKPGQTTLEIGTGSGFQSSLLSRIVKDAYTIEIIEPLGKAVSRIFAPIGYDNVHTRIGDGYYGWPEVKDGFDIIIVTCAATYAPPDLFKQLKPGGRMIIPIGQPFKRGQVLYVYTKDARGKIHSRRDIGVFFIPMTGAIARVPHDKPTAQ